jgi:hypothetical protein
MYREDLDQLVGYFQSGCTSFTISDKKNRYENLDEMKRYVGSRIRDLDIQGYGPGLHFLLNQTEGVPGSPTRPLITFHELRTEEITNEADILFYQVKEFLSSHQEKPFRMPFLVIAIIAFVACVVLSTHNFVVVNGQLAIRGTIAWFVSFITTIVALVCIAVTRNYLTLETRANSPSFFARNRDEIARQGIIASFTLVVGIIVGLVIAHFTAR